MSSRVAATGKPILRLVRTDDTRGDAELVREATHGERAAMHTLYVRHVDYVTGVAVRLSRDIDRGRDIAQESFLLAFEKLPDLREPAAFRPWVTQIAARMAHRQLKRQRWWSRSQEPTLGLADLAREDLSAEARSELTLIDAALSAVTDEQRMAWVLRRVEEEPLESIAAACECSVATVKRWVDIAEHHVRRAVGGVP